MIKMNKTKKPSSFPEILRYLKFDLGEYFAGTQYDYFNHLMKFYRALLEKD